MDALVPHPMASWELVLVQGRSFYLLKGPIPEYNEDIVLTFPLICSMLLELHLDQVLAAADQVVALVAASDQHLVAAAVVEVDFDLHYPAADLLQAVVLGSADHAVDWTDSDPHSHHLIHQDLDYHLDQHAVA